MTRILLAWYFLAYVISAPSLPTVYQGPVVIGPFAEWSDCQKVGKQWEQASQQSLNRASICWQSK